MTAVFRRVRGPLMSALGRKQTLALRTWWRASPYLLLNFRELPLERGHPFRVRRRSLCQQVDLNPDVVALIAELDERWIQRL